MTFEEALEVLEKAQQTSWSWDRFEHDGITKAIEVFKRMHTDLEQCRADLREYEEIGDCEPEGYWEKLDVYDFG